MESIKETATLSPSLAVGSAVVPGRAKVAISFIGTSTDTELLTISGRIVAGLTGNASFSAPLPTLATLTAACSAYVAAVNAFDRGSASVAARNQTRAALGQVLRDLALYVQHTSQGDRVKLISSGFPLQRGRGPAVLGVPGPPQGIKLARGPASGQISARCKAIPGALLYQWRYATVQAPTAWTLSDTSSSGAMLLSGLVPTTEYLVQVRAFGRRGSSDWSDSVSVIAT
jgi:hypothetical protein